MASLMIRTLAEGPDYAPNWRERQAEHYLPEVVAADKPEDKLREILALEKDPFVRQYLRFRYNGRSVNQGAFLYAAGCQARNRETGAASMIRAMFVADRTPDEIAIELGTPAQNIVTFGKVFFDVRRYLGIDSWLRRIVFEADLSGMTKPESHEGKAMAGGGLPPELGRSRTGDFSSPFHSAE